MPVWGRGSDALVDEPGEEAGIDDEGAELRVIGCGWLRGDDFVPGPALPLEGRNVSRTPTSMFIGEPR